MASAFSDVANTDNQTKWGWRSNSSSSCSSLKLLSFSMETCGHSSGRQEQANLLCFPRAGCCTMARQTAFQDKCKVSNVPWTGIKGPCLAYDTLLGWLLKLTEPWPDLQGICLMVWLSSFLKAKLLQDPTKTPQLCNALRYQDLNDILAFLRYN